MKSSLSVIMLVALSCLAFPQGASDYCYSEKAAGESCYQDCCESLGYSWSGGGCAVSESDQSYVSSACGYCTDSYLDCVNNYESGGYSSSSGSYSDSGSGCCSGFIVLALLGASALFAR